MSVACALWVWSLAVKCGCVLCCSRAETDPRGVGVVAEEREGGNGCQRQGEEGERGDHSALCSCCERLQYPPILLQ